MVVIRGRLAPEVGAVLMQALAAARETLYQRAQAKHADDVPAETSRRLACDATRVVMQHDVDGHITEVGARTRTIPPALRREEGYQVERQADGDLRFRRPDGRPLPQVPPPAAVPSDPVNALRAAHDAQGLHVHARTAMPGWLGDRLDVVYAIDVLHPLARPDIEGAAAQPCTAG